MSAPAKHKKAKKRLWRIAKAFYYFKSF